MAHLLFPSACEKPDYSRGTNKIKKQAPFLLFLWRDGFGEIKTTQGEQQASKGR